MTVCRRCILDTKILPELKLDDGGTCTFCRIHDDLEQKNPVDPNRLNDVVKRMKRDGVGKGKRYDCIVGISGGCDSSYLLDLCVSKGLRVLAVHWDNDWNTKIAQNNIKKITEQLSVDVKRVDANREEYDDICRSFLLASVPDADIPNDIAITTVLLREAKANDCHYVLDAHNFRTEGTCPLSWSYMDGKYIESVHKAFGTVPMKTFPNLWLNEWLEYLLYFPVARPRLLYHVEYDKQKVMRYLDQKFGWKWYGGHHMENKYTIFVGNYVQPNKFGIDLRYIEFSALVRNKQMRRDEAVRRIREQPFVDPEIMEEVKQRLNIDIDMVMRLPKKIHNDYETYQQTFHNLEPVFSSLLQKGRIPETFYIKYVKGIERREGK